MLKVTRQTFGPCESQLNTDWRKLASSLLSEKEEENNQKISLLRDAVLDKDHLEGLHDSQFIQDDGFLTRSMDVCAVFCPTNVDPMKVFEGLQLGCRNSIAASDGLLHSGEGGIFPPRIFRYITG